MKSGPPCTVFRPTASIASSGPCSSSSRRESSHSTAARWSATAATSSVASPPSRLKASRDRSLPIDSMRPRATTVSSAMSRSWTFSEVEPRLGTSTLTTWLAAARWRASVSARAIELTFVSGGSARESTISGTRAPTIIPPHFPCAKYVIARKRMFAASMLGAMKTSVASTTGLSIDLRSAAKRLSGASSASGPSRYAPGSARAGSSARAPPRRRSRASPG